MYVHICGGAGGRRCRYSSAQGVLDLSGEFIDHSIKYVTYEMHNGDWLRLTDTSTLCRFHWGAPTRIAHPSTGIIVISSMLSVLYVQHKNAIGRETRKVKDSSKEKKT